MKVAVTSQGPDINSDIDTRFGRAKHFIVVDTETGEFTSHDNARNLDASQGAGIQASRNVSDLGVEAVLTGNVGPKALATLRAGNIAVYTGASGSIGDAVEQFKAGKLRRVEEATVDSHWM